MRRLRSTKALALLLALAMLAAACGSSDDTDPETTSDDGNTTVDDGGDEAASDDGGDDPEPTVDETGEDDAGDGGDGVTEEAREASAPGVTEDTIRVGVLIADLEGLRSIGFPLADALTNEYLVRNISAEFDLWNANGGINGRMVEAVELTWDPLDPATMQDACNKGTLDEELFLVTNASGFSSAFIDCFTVDADMFMLFGETASQEQIDRAPDRLFTLNPPAEVASEVGTQLALDDGIIAPGDKVGILTSNAAAGQAGAASARAILEAAGHEVVEVEVNTQSDDNAAQNAESAAAAGTFDAEGVDHALVLMGFTQASGFWSEVGATNPTWDRTILDTSSANCTPFGASRTDPAAEGAICVTAYDGYSLPEGGLRGDTEFEAECRQKFIEANPDEYNGRSDPGVPSGEILTTADGEEIVSDYAYGPCTITAVLEQALTNAGINPTRDSLAEAMRGVSGPQALRSNGDGAYGPDKNYYSTAMLAMQFTLVPADTPRGEDGTFLGCPAPTNCWRPVTGNWISIG